MSFFRRAGLTSLLALASAMPAAADITPEQAWEFWRSLHEGTGFSVTASSERREGDRLILEGVVASGKTSTMKAELPMGQVVLRDRGDGSVEMTLAPSMEVSVAVSEPNSEPVQMKMRIDQQGYAVVISGDLDTPVLDITADLLTVTQDSPVVNGAEMPMEMQVTLNNLSGQASVAGDQAKRNIAYGFEAETAEFAMAATNPQNGGAMEMSFVADGLSASFEGDLPTAMTPEADLAALMRQGLQGGGTYQTGAVEFTFAMQEADNEITAAGTIDSTVLDVSLTPRGMGYTSTANGLAFAVEGSSIPFPDLNFAAQTYQFGLLLPLLKGDQPDDFALKLRLVDLVIPDSIWGLVDPEARLARDPASIVIDTTGKLQLLKDLVAPPEQMGDDLPGELHALDLGQLQLKAAGAELTGTGAFTFDNSDKQTFPGMPRPTGKADLRLVGGNGLMDNLVALGLVPQDQVMGIRMMLALFARPGEGPDTLTSTIEVTREGQVLANGQRIQ